MDRDVLPEGFELHWYKVQSVLGRGAFGVTYLALDQNLDQLVAIKEYFPNEFASRVTGYTVHPITGEQSNMYAWGLDRFLKEARILAKFKHHNIVRVFSVFEQNNTAYMIMEYERGQELSVLFKNPKRLSEQQLMAIYLPIASGLKLVHDAGFIHRDIKPSNIYIRHADSSPVLIDFGAARNVSGTQTRSLTSLVTQGYAPFEQFNAGDEKQGPWTDIYALGASLFYGVTGELPIDSMARGSSLLSTGIDPYQSATKLAAGKYSMRILHAIDAALMFQPKDRPQTVTAWAAILRGTNQVKKVHDESLSSFDDEATIMVPRHATGRRPVNNSNPHGGNRRDLAHLHTAKASHTDRRSPRKIYPYVWFGVSVVAVVILLVIGKIMLVDIPAEIPQQSVTQTTPKAAPKATPLLDLAREAHTQGNLFAPPQQNAIFYYKKVLQLDPDNQSALSAVKKIVNLYSDSIRNDLAEDYIEEAKRKTDILKNAKIDLNTVAKLQHEIDLLVARENEIGDGLQQARKYLAKGRRVTPEGKNALYYYRRVLSIAGDNQEAQDGVDDISRYYISRAKRNLKKGKLDQVNSDLMLVESIDPQSSSLVALNRQLLRKKNERKRVSQKLLQAQQAFNAGNLIQPAKKNAYFLFNQALIQDRNNAEARQGIKQVTARLQVIFNKQLSAEYYDDAESLLQSIELELPRSQLAINLRNQFSENRGVQESDIAAINSLIGNFKQFFEARDTRALRDVSVFNPDVEIFLRNLFNNYPSFKLKVTNLEFIGKKRLGAANLKITELINKQGSKVEPGDWSRFKIIAQRNDEGQWKVYWGESVLK